MLNQIIKKLEIALCCIFDNYLYAIMISDFTENIDAQKNQENIITYFAKAFSLSLRLLITTEKAISLDHSSLLTNIEVLNNNLRSVELWYNSIVQDDSRTLAYKKNMEEAYDNCRKTVSNLRIFIDRINKGGIDVFWEQPTDNTPLPLLNELPCK